MSDTTDPREAGPDTLDESYQSQMRACPFCGTRGVVQFDHFSGEYFGGCLSDVDCRVLTLIGPCKTPDEVIEIWNTRA